MTKFKASTRKDLPQIAEKLKLDKEQILDMQAVSAVLPFRVNDYVVENLIDPGDVPDDPIFQLTFPQRGMLEETDYQRMRDLVVRGASETEIKLAADEIRGKLNPHPAGQMELNVPKLDGEVVAGMQHKYQETVLFFPTQGQTCHAYCSYCFRWAQFIGDADLKFASKEAEELARYVRENPQVSSVLITGGDPMVMKTSILRRYIEPLLSEDLPNLHSIRIGTKALAYWPHRFTEGEDADDFLRLIWGVKEAGRQGGVGGTGGGGPRDARIGRWVEVYWAGDGEWFLGRVAGERLVLQHLIERLAVRVGDLERAGALGDDASQIPGAGAGPPDLDPAADSHIVDARRRPGRRRDLGAVGRRAAARDLGHELRVAPLQAVVRFNHALQQ